MATVSVRSSRRISGERYSPPSRDLAKNRPLYEKWDEALKSKWKVREYLRAGITGKREDYVYYPIVLGINRAIDWLAKQDWVDTRSFSYSGTSQGGGFGLALLALNDNLKRGSVFVPAITGHYQYLDGHQNGWPWLLDERFLSVYSSEERAARRLFGV